MKNKSNVIFNISLIASIYILGLIIFNENYKFALIFSMILLIYNIVKFRSNNVLFIFQLFLLTYLIPIFYFYFLGFQLTPHSANFYDNANKNVTICYSIFCVAISLTIIYKCSPSIKEGAFKIYNKLKLYDNLKLYILSNIIIIVFIIFGHNSAINIGGYGVTGSTANVLNEYIIIFFLVSYVFCGDIKYRKVIIFILYILYAIINFLYGDRIGVLQCALLLFYLFIDKRVTYKVIIPAIILVNLLLNAVGTFRATGELVNNNANNETNIINTNQSQVYNSSIVLYKIVNSGILQKEQRIKSFGEYLLRIFIDRKNLSNLSELTSYSQIYYNAQGGGFISIYFYIWLGSIGSFIISIFIGNVLVVNNNKKNNITAIPQILILSLYPRWLAYEPIQLVKIPLYGILIYLAFLLLHRTFMEKLS